jgi:hypothetical protein
MYAWIWRLLPGRPATRALVALGLVLILVVLLWYVVFPWIEPKIQFDHGTVEGGISSPAKP